MSTLSPARRVALSALMDARESERYVRELFSHGGRADALDPRDASLALRLALGVTATEGCLDDALNMYLDRPRKVAPRVRMAMRISAYEALYLRTPADVVVSQGVELVRTCARGATGLANAVLRRVCEHRDEFLDALDVDPSHREMVSLARRAGLPAWLTRRISDAHPRAAEGVLEAQRSPAPISMHLNPRVTRSDAAWMARAGAVATALPGCFETAHVGELVHEGVFDRADAVASDVHAQLVATAATRPGSCLEIGAGRGTKTFVMLAQAARAGFDHDHVSLDLYEGKCAANLTRIRRADLGRVRTVHGDARDLDDVLQALDIETGTRSLFDTVFVDAPCSGTGTMRRHGEIPWRLQPQDVAVDLPQLQRELLEEAARRVAPHGELVYATCSILAEENLDVIWDFLDSEVGAGFKLEPLSGAEIFSHPGFREACLMVRGFEERCGAFQSVPAPEQFDGHFCARLVRVG